MTNASFVVTIVLLCITWYTFSSFCNVINKIILQEFPYPLTITMASLVSSTLYSIPMLIKLRIPFRRGWHAQQLRYVLPLAFGKILAASTSYISIWKVPVSFAHTIKATMPLFAVICARVFLKEKQSCDVYASLLPIICGVAIATLTELSFDMTGFLCALLSTLIYALLNTFVKKVLQETNLHHVKLLSLISQFASFAFLPFWIWNDMGNWISLTTEVHVEWPDLRIIILIVASGFISFCQNLATFTLIKKLTALSYAVANAAKRITVIMVSLALLHNPVTTLNVGSAFSRSLYGRSLSYGVAFNALLLVFGMALSIFGVLFYNQAKHRQARLANAATPLPMTMSASTLSDATLLRQAAEFSIAQDYVQSPLLGSPAVSARSSWTSLKTAEQNLISVGEQFSNGQLSHHVKPTANQTADRNQSVQNRWSKSPKFYISSNKGEDI